MFKPALANVICKIVGYTVVLKTVSWIAPETYPTLTPLLVTVMALTAVGSVADWVFPPKIGNLPSLFLGLPGMMLIVWGISRLFPTVDVGLLSAFLIACCIGPIEYLLHKAILNKIDHPSN